MKYLYMIFRLFKCPHKWEPYKIWEVTHKPSGNCVKQTHILKCKRCGNLKNHEVDT